MPPLKDAEKPSEPVVLVLGFFDGVHKGHQQVIAAGRREADKRGLKLALATFDVHPAIVYGGVDAASFKYLSLPERKTELMAQFGVDLYYVIHFTKTFAALKPQQFVNDYMCGLKAQVVVAGFDYTYGKKDVASMALLTDYAQGRFEVITVPSFDVDGQKVSSTRVRQALADADIDLTNRLLGYTYTTRGTVVHGEARGRELGFPTANIEHVHGTFVPGIGIYVVKLTVDGKTYGGMASVGRNVTFGDDRDVTVEINLFDFNQDIYGKAVTVEWLHYLRGEVKYTGAAALIDQLKVDEVHSRTFLQRFSTNDSAN